MNHEPQVWCPNREQHDGHWYTIRAGGITCAGGWCQGEARGECGADLEDTLPGQGITCTLGPHPGNRHEHDDPNTGAHIAWTDTRTTNHEKVNT